MAAVVPGVCLGIVAVVLGLCLWSRTLLLNLSASFPATEPSPEETVAGQSLILGGLLLPCAVALGRTERFLHIEPGPLMRRFGTGAVQIPWDLVQVERCGRKYCTLRSNETWLSGPARLLRPAGPESEE